MTRSEATKILAVLAAAYPTAAIKNASPTEAEGIVTVWEMQFANIPADIVFMAINKHISTGKFFPSISEIKAKLSDVHWDAYTKLDKHNSKYLSAAQIEEYKRIYESTKKYKMGTYEPAIDEMMIEGSKQFLLE
jgi:hypothetical protein